MEFNFSGEKPLFQQVADQIAEGIFNGAYLEGEQIPSTTEISKSYYSFIVIGSIYVFFLLGHICCQK